MSVLFETVSHVNRSAAISECGKYRWWLYRSWQLWDREGMHVKSKGTCCFVMLNPSTADGMRDDPTIRRCINFARDWGYSVLRVRNLFPWRATNPKELLTADDPIGDRGDSELLAACTADLVVAAWGGDVPFERDESAMRLFRVCFPDKPIHCLKLTKNGKPWHPLYVKADTQPQLFNLTPKVE